MTIPDVRFVPCADPALGSGMESDPTGFLRMGFRPQKINDLCELATFQYRKVLNRNIPDILRARAERKVPLFYHSLGAAVTMNSPTQVLEKPEMENGLHAH